MKFTAVLLGAVLVIGGLLAYSVIPNVHTIPVQSSLLLASPLPIVVRPGFQAETQQNITILPDRSSEMIINVTASLDSGSPSSINFKLFTGSQMSSCTNDTNPSGCLVNEIVSNETIRVPLNASTTYYFVFDNKDSSSSRIVLFSASLLTSSVKTLVARDGELNFVALGFGGVGLLVVLYGVAAKTVIPWE